MNSEFKKRGVSFKAKRIVRKLRVVSLKTNLKKRFIKKGKCLKYCLAFCHCDKIHEIINLQGFISIYKVYFGSWIQKFQRGKEGMGKEEVLGSSIPLKSKPVVT
jgi:hypothetical protein